MNPLVLGLDVGTSSTKAVLVTTSGAIVAAAERPHGISRPKPGWVEQDADGVWWNDTVSLCRELSSAYPNAVSAVGVSGLGPCLLPVDSLGRPLRPAILYGVDTRAAMEIEEITQWFGSERILERGGSALTSQAVGPKLLWLRRHEPNVWSRTRRFLMASSYLVYRLTGEYMLDHHSASQCDPLYEIESEGWALDWAEEVAPGVQLPNLFWSDEVVGVVTRTAAEATGLPEGVPVVAGTIDAWAEAMSAGVRSPGDVMLMYGTTLFIIESVSEIVPSPTIWGTAGVRRGSRTLAAGMATSGALTQWFRHIAGDRPYDELVAEAAATPPGGDGLVVLPYFAGERTPIFDPDARGLILGLTLSHGRGHIYRALLEATAYGVRHILEALEAATTAPIRRVVAVGGGTKGGLWTQIVSDVTGQPQQVPRETVGAAYGDALLAAIGTGLVPPETDWTLVHHVVMPNSRVAPRYDALYDLYLSLYPATAQQAHVLAAIQRQPRTERPDARS